MDRTIVSGGKNIIPFKLGGSPQGQDQYLVYEFMKRMLIPYDQWEAYSTGVIDKNGKILIPKIKRTSKQNRSFGNFDNLMIKLRELVKTAPTARNKLLPATAALYLLKEYKAGKQDDDLDIEAFKAFQALVEDAMPPANNVGDGKIAGANQDPPGPAPLGKKKRVLLRRKKVV